MAATVVPEAGGAAAPPHQIDLHYHHITPTWVREDAVRNALAPQSAVQATGRRKAFAPA